jgi:NADH:ubiquinone oxidoreductase subunit 5 (subunit L)/multisubunit Na+/H+ antiporter MnhA subunit
VHQIIVFRLIFYLFRFLIFPAAVYTGLLESVLVLDWEIIILAGTPITVSLLFDFISLMFSFTVFFISANVFWFGVGYMHGELYIKRFCYLVFFFVLSMNVLIFSGNLLTTLLGWDGLGFTSFLLVIYYINSYSLGAGLITVLTNRLGDIGLILSIGVLSNGGH